MPRSKTQTVVIGGVRTVITTRPDGNVTTKPADPLEWEVQAACVTELKLHPQFNKDFTLAGDFNAGRRGQSEAAKAKATGITPGEHDLRLYMKPGILGLIEYKVNAPVSDEQKERHKLLADLGFTYQQIIRAKTIESAIKQTMATLSTWLEQTSTQ